MDKKQVTIPNFVWVIAVVLILCILFMIFVQTPYNKEAPKYDADHASATSQIDMYKDYLARADEVSKSIVDMSDQYAEISKKMFVNAATTADDIRDMLKKLGYSLSNLSVTEGSPTGVISSDGDPLYRTNISYTFTTTKQKALETLKYFEDESQGAYYISNITFSKVKDTTEASTATSTKTSASDQYMVILTISLYYYNPDMHVAVSSAASTSSSSTASSK